MRDRHLMTVGELSRRAGMPIKAVRQYTDWGLVFTAGRSRGNYRLYTNDALWCLQQIRLLRDLGLTLAEIRHLCAIDQDVPLGPRLARHLRRARARIDAQIADLQRTRNRINQFETQHEAFLTRQAGGDLWIDNPPAARPAA